MPISWEEVDVTPILKDGKTVIPDDAIKSIKTNTVALKGPLATPSTCYFAFAPIVKSGIRRSRSVTLTWCSRKGSRLAQLDPP